MLIKANSTTKLDNEKTSLFVRIKNYVFGNPSKKCSEPDKTLEKKTCFADDKKTINQSQQVSVSLSSVQSTSSIDNWHILSQLPLKLKKKIRLAAVDNREAIFVTKDDKAYWVKANDNTVKTTVANDNEENILLRIQPRLSGLKIKSLAFARCRYVDTRCIHKSDYYSILTLTTDGRVFVWSFGGHRLFETSKPDVMFSLISKTVVQLACGDEHALALTSDGEVYAWGDNKFGQLGIGNRIYKLDPVKVTDFIGHRRTIGVACCGDSSIAVMDNGEVYTWGWNSLGKLGDESETKLTTPMKIQLLEGIKIRRLDMGYGYVLALADDGSMYSWGLNEHGQLGTGDKNYRVVPAKIGLVGVKFIEVAASNSYNFLSAAFSDDGRCWVWGKCKNESGSVWKTRDVLLPEPVQSISIQDAFAKYAVYQMTWKTMVV